MTKQTLERLGLIKYLSHLAIQQSVQPEPLNGFSVLQFHDSVELFLNLTCETLNIKVPQNFMEYWPEINKVTNPDVLSHQTSMLKLNKSRVGFKHHGIIPSKTDIESFRVTTLSFLTENYAKFFKIEFEKVSLLDLIENIKCKSHIQKAEEAFANKSLEECLNNLSKSFGYLLHDYESNKIDKRYRNPFNFSGQFRSLQNIPHKLDNESNRFLTDVKNSIISIQEILRLLTIGIDYKKYIKFSAYVPGYSSTSSDEIIPHYISRKTLSFENFDFCKNFIIDTAFKLQESDFNLDENDYYG